MPGLRAAAVLCAACSSALAYVLPGATPAPKASGVAALRMEAAGVLPSVPWTSFAMRAVGLDAAARTVELEPWDDAVAESLDRWRAAVAACRPPAHVNAVTLRCCGQAMPTRA